MVHQRALVPPRLEVKHAHDIVRAAAVERSERGGMDARREASDPNQNGLGRRRQSLARIQGLGSAPMLPRIPQSTDFIRVATVKTLQRAPGEARSPEKPNERRPRRRHLEPGKEALGSAPSPSICPPFCLACLASGQQRLSLALCKRGAAASGGIVRMRAMCKRQASFWCQASSKQPTVSRA